ncbi:MAG: family 78 glycoside hydrolase catalytic domain [Prevotella sp.]|nr:family 78 glycoside hydrolase catalytic domain [Prevotella sp.]
MKRLLLFLLALAPFFCYAQFDLRSSLLTPGRADASITLLSLNRSLDDAKWIGSNQYVLYADYLTQFKISWTVQLDGASERLAVIFGGNDPRLMNRNMNILGVENGRDESYIKLEIDAAAAHLNVWRMGYTTKGKELLRQFELQDFDAQGVHAIGADCCLGDVDIMLDGQKLGTVELNPMGKGGDYIAFPQLADIGYEMEAGQRAYIHKIEVRNLRSPFGVLYETHASQKIGNKKKAVRKLTSPSHGAMPLLRCQFALKQKAISAATLTATARGIYRAELNGRQVGSEYYAPGISQYNKTHYYQQYDVTRMLQATNTLYVQLAEGWWAGGMTYSGGNWNYFGDQLAFRAKLTVRYEDGDSTVITTQPDDRWEVCDETKVTYASMFQGEVYDNTVTAGRWRKASEMALDGHLPTEGGGTQPKVNDYSSFHLEPATTHVGLYTTLKAVSVGEVRHGVFVYDMGQNMAGFPRITMRKLRKGQRVVMRYAEVLYPDLPEYGDKVGTLMLENIRAAMAQDIYIANGDTCETFTPDMTLHGYRYVEITGIDRPLPVSDVEGMVVSSIDRFTADFECSNPLVNRLWQNIQWSMLANFISMPTDCPQRNERMGWSGDISVFSRTAVNMADVDDFLSKHIQAMRDVQTSDGRFPDIAPVGGGFGGLLWGSAGITVPWECWLQYADRDILARHYETMKAYIDYVDSHYFDAATGLLVQERQWGDLGDWLGLEDGKNDKTLLFEAYYIYDLDILRQTALMLGKEADAKRYGQRMEERKQFFVDTYIDKQTGMTRFSAFYPDRKGEAIDIQGSYVLPLAFNIVTDTLRQKLVERLVTCIERENTTDKGVKCPPYSLMTGFITTAWISRVLSDAGRSDVAYRLLQQEDYPSWLYPVTQGATTIWERLNSYTHTAGFGGNNSMNSFNHYSFGAVGQWLVNRCLGIERDERQPGLQHFILRPEPDPTGKMTYARGHLDTRHGRIESSWQRNPDGTVSYRFVVPEGTSATLVLPDKSPTELKPGTYNSTF